MRLFVGLPLPDPIRSEIQSLAGGLPGAKWVPPQNLHITLRFIGEAGRGAFDDILLALSAIRAPHFSLNLQGIGHFGTGRHLRALWTGVTRDAALHHLHDKIESALVRIGLEPEGRKFLPHVTLARIKSSIPHERLQSYLAAHGLFRTASFAVTHYTLFSSQLGNDHAVYYAEAEFPLRPPSESP